MTSNVGIFHVKNSGISQDLKKKRGGGEGEKKKEVSGAKDKLVLFSFLWICYTHPSAYCAKHKAVEAGFPFLPS